MNLRDIATKFKKLKDSLPEGLLASGKVDLKYDRSRGIIVKSGGQVVIIENMHLNGGTFALPYHPALFNIEKREYEHKKAYFIRTDLLPSVGQTRDLPVKYSKIIDKLKPYIDNKDIASLKFSAVICNEEDKGANEASLTRLRRNLGGFPSSKRRSVLYNWMRCGNVFDEEIFPWLEFLKQPSLKEELCKLFSSYWDSMIAYHPMRIFVRKDMTEDELSGEIYERLIMREQDKVYVYARGGRIPFANEVTNDITKTYDYYGCKKEKYQLGNSPAETLIVFKKK